MGTEKVRQVQAHLADGLLLERTIVKDGAALKPVALAVVGDKQADGGLGCRRVLHVDDENSLNFALGVVDVLHGLPLDVGPSLALRDLADDRGKPDGVNLAEGNVALLPNRVAARDVAAAQLSHPAHAMADGSILNGGKQLDDAALEVDLDVFLGDKVHRAFRHDVEVENAHAEVVFAAPNLGLIEPGELPLQALSERVCLGGR